MENKKLNVVFGKYGKSLLFSQSSWGIVGGDQEGPALLSTLAQMNPNINFYILGRSDWNKLPEALKQKINVNNNIIDMWENWTRDKAVEYDWPLKYMEEHNIKFDYGIFISGLVGNCNMPDSVLRLDGTGEVAKAIEMTQKYTGPIIKFINATNIPYSELGEDPRYFPCKARDLFYPPKYIMSTRDVPKHFKVRYVKEYLSERVYEEYMPIVFRDINKMFLASEPDRRLKEPGKRTNLISVYANHTAVEGNRRQKFPKIKEYVLDNFEGSTLYGKWDFDYKYVKDDIIHYKDRIFNTPMIDLGEQMLNTKYTFMITANPYWPSSKYYKHLLFGIIPFFHPFAQSEYTPNPDFLNIKSAKEFKEKIEYLESDEKRYLDLWYECQSVFKDEHFSGHHFNNIILKEIKENCDTRGVNLDEIKEKQFNLSCLYKNEQVDVKELRRQENASKIKQLF